MNKETFYFVIDFMLWSVFCISCYGLIETSFVIAKYTGELDEFISLADN